VERISAFWFILLAEWKKLSILTTKFFVLQAGHKRAATAGSKDGL
jgi:hypothetical protein